MNFLKKIPNKNILIIDDEKDVLELLRIYLESQGWNVAVTESPSQAFDLLRQQPFFLILTDIAMPEMDGYELITALESDRVPSSIALMTGFGYNPRHTLVKISKKNKYPVFFKPFEFKKPKLRETVQLAWESYHRDIQPV